MPYPKQGNEKGIWRVGRSGTSGYRSCVRHQGKTINKYFSAGQYDGPEGAYEAAVKWRNKKERELGIVRTNRRLDVKRERGATGLAGIQRKKSGFNVTIRAIVQISDQYPEQEALKRAIKLRQRLQVACAKHNPQIKRSRKKVKGEKGIHRIDGEKSLHGYSSCVWQRGRPVRKFFSDNKHGGTEGAQRAAIDWRNQTATELGIIARTNPTGIRRAKSGYLVEVTTTILVSELSSEQSALERAIELRKILQKVCAGII
jgi:hypothetical protein